MRTSPPDTKASDRAAPVIAPSERFLRINQVLDMTARGRTAVLDDVKAGTFPRPIKCGASTRWLHSEVLEWMAARVAESRAPK